MQSLYIDEDMKCMKISLDLNRPVYSDKESVHTSLKKTLMLILILS